MQNHDQKQNEEQNIEPSMREKTLYLIGLLAGIALGTVVALKTDNRMMVFVGVAIGIALGKLLSRLDLKKGQ